MDDDKPASGDDTQPLRRCKSTYRTHHRHDTRAEERGFRELLGSSYDHSPIIHIVDTQLIVAEIYNERKRIGLDRLINKFSLVNRHSHDAGNDVVYTAMEAFNMATEAILEQKSPDPTAAAETSSRDVEFNMGDRLRTAIGV